MSARARIIDCLLGSILIIHCVVAPESACRADETEQRSQATEALALAPCAANFGTRGYEKNSHLWVSTKVRIDQSVAPETNVARAIERRGGASLIVGFALRREKELNPDDIQKLLASTRNRQDAVAQLWKNFEWKTSRDNLSKYVRRHRLNAPWQKVIPERSLIENIVQASRTESEAITRLAAETLWRTSAAGLSRYLRNHAIFAPWRHLDRATVATIIQESNSTDDAVARISERLGREMTRRALADYLKRAGIAPPWPNPREKGFLVGSLSVGLAVLATSIVGGALLWDFGCGTRLSDVLGGIVIGFFTSAMGRVKRSTPAVQSA